MRHVIKLKERLTASNTGFYVPRKDHIQRKNAIFSKIISSISRAILV